MHGGSIPKGGMVGWTRDGESREGYLVRPEGPQKGRPAVVVIHEIGGLDAHIRDVCDRFAREGLVALGPQLYAGKLKTAMTPARIRGAVGLLRSATPGTQQDPRKMASLQDGKSPEERSGLQTLMRVMDPEQSRRFAKDAVAALEWLRQQSGVDPARTDCLGFSMGGGGITALVAGLDPQLKVGVIFYGANPPPELVPKIRASLLGLYGGEDHRVTDTVPALVEAARTASVPFTYRIYPKAQHAFFNDTRPQVHHPEAAADAWMRTRAFPHEPLAA